MVYLAKEITLRFSAALIGSDLEFKEGDISLTLTGNIVSSISMSCGSFDIDLRGFLVMPPLSNMHVHVLDYAFPEYGNELYIDDLVGEPHGLKYKLLRKASESDLRNALNGFRRKSESLGVGFVMEFRELGVKGLMLDWRFRPYGWAALAMPSTHNYVEVMNELDDLLNLSNGLGISSPLYFSEDLLRSLTNAFRIRGKPVAMHVSETKETWLRGDFNVLKSVNFDNVVHGTWLGSEELMIIKEKGMNLILCPRSNLWFKAGIPRITEAYSLKINTALGTDNCAWIEPNPWKEAEALLLLMRLHGLHDPKWVIKALTNAKPIGEDNELIEGGIANLLVLRYRGTSLERAKDKYSAIIKRGENLVSCLMMNGELRYCDPRIDAVCRRIRYDVC